MFPPSVKVFIVGLPLPLPVTLILPSVFIWTKEFLIEPLPATGSIPCRTLFTAVLAEELKGSRFTKLPPSVLNRRRPSSAVKSSSSVWFGFTLNVFPLPTKSFSSISSRISEEDLFSVFASPTSLFTWTWTTGVSQLYTIFNPDPERILPERTAWPFEDQSLLPSFGLLGIPSLHPEGIPLFVATSVELGVAGWVAEYLKIKLVLPGAPLTNEGELQLKVPETPEPEEDSVARVVDWTVIVAVCVPGSLWVHPVGKLAITPVLKLKVPVLGVEGKLAVPPDPYGEYW